MKVFLIDVLDDEGRMIDLAFRALEAGHQVRYFTERKLPVGKGLVQKVSNWQESLEWAELTVLGGNCDYPKGFEEYFSRGYPIFGTNPAAAELELDRGRGQEVLELHGVETLPFKVVGSLEEAARFLVKEKKPFAFKPWGGECDKSMTAVPRDVNEGLFILDQWKRQGTFKGELMLQECVKGVEIGVSAFFGPGGWSRAIEESFEHKRFMNDDLGENTGEMGTVIRHVTKSKLFDMLLEPITDFLHLSHFVGDCSVNCIVDSSGTPWPLEFTMRLGWPDFCIRQAVIESDPVEWMAELLYGRDALKISSDVALGVVMTHGDFPKDRDPPEKWSGFPLNGITDDNLPHLHFQQVQDGKAPRVVGGQVREVSQMLTAGTYLLIASGRGKTVSKAQQRAYETAWQITLPSNRMFRTDIGERLREDLPQLQKHGFAVGMEY